MSCDYDVVCLFLVQKKIKKGKEYKINIKLEKLNKRKEKLSVFKVFHNINLFLNYRNDNSNGYIIHNQRRVFNLNKYSRY